MIRKLRRPQADAPPGDADGGSDVAQSAVQTDAPSDIEAESPVESAKSARKPDAVVPPGVTPSMAQFLEIKTANPDCILWYRMGDFYELFFEDAVVASAALGIVLTKRGKHLGDDIPMCGVPVHRADEYLQRLIRKGYRVAVCEQLEDPAEARKRGSKAVVRRDVVRLVTPGTLTEDSLLDAKARNYRLRCFARRAAALRQCTRLPRWISRPASSKSARCRLRIWLVSWRGCRRAKSSPPMR